MNYFYVYQNKTYFEEQRGGFLWSPKYAKGWSLNAGYETMKQVRPGDIIMHSYQGEIVAISIAKTSCYSAPRPGFAFSEWDNDGWKIDVEYYVLRRNLLTSPHIPYLYKVQPQNGPYTAAFRGKQQYLCNSNKTIFDYLINKIIDIQYSKNEQESIRKFINLQIETKPIETTPQKPKKYVLCPVCELNYMLEGQEKCETCMRNI